MGADMLLRDLYLPAGTAVDLPAAKKLVDDLCWQATVADLRILLDHDWISHSSLYDDDPPDARIAEHATELRATAAQSLYQLLDAFAASLHGRDVARFR